MRTTGLVFGLTIMLLFPALLWSHEGHQHKVMGTVSAVDQSQLEVETRDGSKVSVSLNQQTEYFRGKAKATAADVKVGERVVAVFIAKGDQKIAQKILLTDVVD
jgi:hypothetical protein